MNTAATLKDAQADMVSALMSAHGDWPAALGEPASQLAQRGWQAYRANAHASAERALAQAFPVIRQLIGDDAFDAMARAFWHAHPPARGDLAQWGSRLPEWLDQDEQLADLPYLADVAQVEWAMHAANTAPDAGLDLASFAVLADGQHDPAECRLQIASGFALLQSEWPAATIIQTHLASAPDWDSLASRLRRTVPHAALVWRQQWRVAVAEIASPAEVRFLQSLAAGLTIGQALEAAEMEDENTIGAEANVAFDFEPWLANAVQQGWIVGALPPRDSSTPRSPSQLTTPEGDLR